MEHINTEKTSAAPEGAADVRFVMDQVLCNGSGGLICTGGGVCYGDLANFSMAIIVGNGEGISSPIGTIEWV